MSKITNKKSFVCKATPTVVGEVQDGWAAEWASLKEAKELGEDDSYTRDDVRSLLGLSETSLGCDVFLNIGGEYE